MKGFEDPIAVLRQKVKDMQWQAEKLRREAHDLELRAGEIYNASVELDLLTDKIAAAQAQGEAA